MLTRKSGILALILGVSVFGAACEEKSSGPIVTPAEVAVNIVPETVAPIAVGQSVSLFANVTGTTNQAVTWSTSNAAVADVSQAGVVTTAGKVAGTAIIRATSQADATKSDAVQITTTAGPVVPPATPPNVTIQSVTQNGTNLPVNPGNVQGVIDVTANVDVPANTAGSVTISLVDAAGAAIPGPLGATRCQQTFTGAGPSGNVDASAVPVNVVCSINTAELDSAGLAIIRNGTYRIRAVVVAGNQQASAISQPYLFNNIDMLSIVVRTDSMVRAVDAVGLAFYGGNVIVHVRPAIYSTTQTDPLGAVSSMQVTLTTSGPGSFAANTGSWYTGAACTADNDLDGTSDLVDASPACAALSNTVTATRVGTSNLFRAVFSAATAVTAGGGAIGSIEDRGGVTITPTNVVTVGGNAFSGNFGVFFPSATPGTAPVPIAAPNLLRVDNLGPRVTAFDLTTATLGCAAAGITGCYVNDTFAFGTIPAPTAGVQTGSAATYSAGGAAGFRNVDFGSDRQTTTFDIVNRADGTAVATNVTTPTGVAETSTANTYAVRANVRDAVGNTSSVFANQTASAPTTTITATTQTIGVDRTRPVILPLSAAACTAAGGALVGTACVAPPFVQNTDASEANTSIIVALRDTSVAPAGPSGFSGTGTPPVVLGVTLFNAANPAGVAGAGTATCAAINASQSACTITITDAATAAAMGYYRVRMNVRDASFPGGNTSDPTVEVTFLEDEIAPIVAGVTAPSTITPNASVTFAADMSDNVELGDNLVSLGYPLALGGAVTYYAHAPRAALGTFGFDNGLCSSTSAAIAGCPAGSFTFQAGQMPASLQTTTAGAPNAADAVYANAVNFAVRDMAGARVGTVCAAPGPGSDGTVTQGSAGAAAPNGSCIERENNNIQPNILAGNAGAAPFNFATLGAFTFVQNAVCRSTAAVFERPCPAASSTVVTLQAEARGPQGVFENPFPQGVRFYVLDASGRWVTVEGTAGVQVFDDDVLNVRRWIYTLVTSTAVVPATTTVRAIGIRNTSSGTAGLIATPDQVTP